MLSIYKLGIPTIQMYIYGVYKVFACIHRTDPSLADGRSRSRESQNVEVTSTTVQK
jgi:hypothetical protein